MTIPKLPLNYSEPHSPKSAQKLNWLRAAVLGANDGIVSVASIVVGVAGASNSSGFILTAGVAGLVAGALSMGVGEYISVSTQRDTEKALLEIERAELVSSPKLELEELIGIYKEKGLTEPTARKVAEELTAKDVFAAHFDAELGIDPNNLTNPWHASLASATSFLIGAAIPLIAILLPPESIRIPVAFLSVIIALVITGIVSGKMSGANTLKATIRVAAGGILAMIVTYSIGKLFGVSGV